MTISFEPPNVGVDATRVSWRLSPSGEVAACTAVIHGIPRLEIRHHGGRRWVDVPHLSVHSQLLPADDASILMCHHRHGVHLIESVDPHGRLTTVATSRGQSALLARVGAGVLLLEACATRTSVLRVLEGRLEPIGTLVGRAVGAVSLNGSGTSLAVNVLEASRPCKAVEMDLVNGKVRPLLSVTETSEDQVLDFLPDVNLVVVSTTAFGEARVGYGRPGEEAVRFPEGLSCGGPVSYVGSSPDGSFVAVAAEAGAATSLRLVVTGTGQVMAPSLPPLVVVGRGHLDGRGLIVPVATPDHAGTLLRLDPVTGQHSFEDEAADGAPVELRTLPGASGAVECVVVGDPLTAETVVIALHGGPLDRWRVQHDPLLSGMARSGIAVVAPNVRGSTGYGLDHALAIRDKWGGPDLDDVLAVAAAVRAARAASRPSPVVVGHSYGAWLAVLAVAAEPDAWSGCVAISPFLSGRRVVDHGGPVAELVKRLGGTDGPDLRERAGSITVPVLVMHGDQDTVVPASEADLLAAALPPRLRNVVWLRDCGHEVFTSPRRGEALGRVTAFCRHSRRHAATRPSHVDGRG